MIKSRFIQEETYFWACSSPFWEAYFETGWVKELIQICDVILHGNPAIEILMSKFIAGLALYPISIKSQSEQQTKEVNKLMQPVLKLIVSDFKSEQWQKYLISKEITGQVKILVGKETEPIGITQDEIFLHIDRTSTFPLTREDIIALEKSWKRYAKVRHQDETIKQQNESNEPSSKVKAWIVYFEKKSGNDNSVIAAITRISSERGWKGSLNTIKNGYDKINKIENNKETFSNNQKSDLFTAISLLSEDIKAKASKYYLNLK